MKASISMWYDLAYDVIWMVVLPNRVKEKDTDSASNSLHTIYGKL